MNRSACHLRQLCFVLEVKLTLISFSSIFGKSKILTYPTYHSLSVSKYGCKKFIKDQRFYILPSTIVKNQYAIKINRRKIFFNSIIRSFFCSTPYKKCINDQRLCIITRVKKRVSERVLPRGMHIIQSETLGKTLAEREKQCQESRQKSHREYRRESRIGLYAWLLTRLSQRLVSFWRVTILQNPFLIKLN